MLYIITIPYFNQMILITKVIVQKVRILQNLFC